MGLPTGWAAPKIDWAADDAPTATHFNAFEGNTKAIETGERTIDQSVTPADNTVTLSQYVDEIAHQLNAVIGKDHWYDAPDTTINEISERFTVSGVAMNAASNPDYTTASFLDTPTMAIMQKICVSIPSGKSLVVKRARYHIDEKSYRIIVFRDPADIPGYPLINLLSWYAWLGADNSAGDHCENDETPVIDNVVAWNGAGAPILKTIYIALWGDVGTSLKSGDGWAIEFGFEDTLPTTTTTAGA